MEIAMSAIGVGVLLGVSSGWATRIVLKEIASMAEALGMAEGVKRERRDYYGRHAAPGDTGLAGNA